MTIPNPGAMPETIEPFKMARPVMRVAFAGASGTGKTTLAKYVAERFGIPLNPIGSRLVAQGMGFANPYAVDEAGRRVEFQRALLARKRGWEMMNGKFVTDRTVVDNLAYTGLHAVDAVDELLLSEVRRGMARYTHIFVCPMSSFFDLGGDPARVQDVAYHRMYEGFLLGLMGLYQSPDTKVLRFGVADLAERKRVLDAVLA